MQYYLFRALEQVYSVHHWSLIAQGFEAKDAREAHDKGINHRVLMLVRSAVLGRFWKLDKVEER